MNIKSRITSILKAKNLDYSITSFKDFDLSNLNLESELDFSLPSNLRLGHLAEKVVSGLIKLSTNYNLIKEGIQLKVHNKTIGELDFIIEEIETKRLIHIELAYKFYLFDPNLSSEHLSNWIGPNRKDSLTEKLHKLEKKQFPLLYHSAVKSTLGDIEINEISQALCLLVNLFIPYDYDGRIDPAYEKVIKGYYIDFKTFARINTSEKSYYLPLKKEWGIDPSDNENWTKFDAIKEHIITNLSKKKASLVWQKHERSYSTFFVVWW